MTRVFALLLAAALTRQHLGPPVPAQARQRAQRQPSGAITSTPLHSFIESTSPLMPGTALVTTCARSPVGT